MAKWRAAPRFALQGQNPTIEFNKDDGLNLSGWFISSDMAAPLNPPTEREMVASIFRYILDNYTDRGEALLGEDFIQMEEGDDPCYEIPVGVVMSFARN